MPFHLDKKYFLSNAVKGAVIFRRELCQFNEHIACDKLSGSLSLPFILLLKFLRNLFCFILVVNFRSCFDFCSKDCCNSFEADSKIIFGAVEPTIRFELTTLSLRMKCSTS